NGLDAGVTQLVLRVVLFLCLGVAIAGGFAWSQFRGLSDAEAMEYAQLGRNIADGHGFVTRCIRPVDFRQLEGDVESGLSISPLPDLRKGPIYPLMLAYGFKVAKPSFDPPASGKLFEPEQKVIMPAGIVLLLMTSLVVFFLGLKLFGQRVAILSMILTLVNGTLLSFSISGTPIPLAVFLLSVVLLLLLHAASAYAKRTTWMLWGGLIGMAGLLCGLSFLTLYALVALVPMVLIWLWFSFGNMRGLAIFIFIALFAVCVAPWMMRNQVVAGAPLGLAPAQVVHDTFVYEGASYDRALAPELSNSITTLAVKNKFKRNLSNILDSNLGLGGLGIIGAFFLVSLLARVERQEQSVLKWSIVAGLFFMTIAVALCGMGALRLMVLFFPIMILFGVAFFCGTATRLTNYMDEYEYVPGAALVIVSALPVLLTIFATRGSIPYPPYYPPLVSSVANILDDDELLCSDIPWATAWYGNHTSVLLPAKVGDLAVMAGFGWKCSGIYLADGDGVGARKEDHSWRALYRREVPEGFELQHGVDIPPGSKDQLFLTDADRWK
ncbi:MAG: hypothetical protein KAI74_00230, partial [Kiritimatiellae bacterium]|nr:hypothetical protein [Kiritimatiellia bacterium]